MPLTPMTWTKKYGNKFGAKRTEVNGRKYNSKFEAGVAVDLEWQLKAGVILEVRPQVTLDLYCYGKKIGTYRMDFVVKTAPKCYKLIEAKGMEMGLWKWKWATLEAQLDHKDFRKANGFKMTDEILMEVVKQRSNYRFK